MDSTRLMWVGLGWTYVMGWVEFFFDPQWWVGSKNLLNLTQPDSYMPQYKNMCNIILNPLTKPLEISQIPTKLVRIK